MMEKYPDLEFEESTSKTERKHIPTRLFKQAVNLSKQARAIEATLDGISPLNAGKKKEEALAMLKKWFPQMENFSGQLKKYKVTINDLLEENQKLEARTRASESGKMKDHMERAKLESELQNIQRLVDRIPPDVLAEVKQQPYHGKEITLENLSPVFTPEQEAAKRRELDQQLYEVFRKYAAKRQNESARA